MNTYQVVRVGGMWRVIDRSCGRKTLAFRESYKAAVEYAQDREFMREISIVLIAADLRENRSAA